MGQRHRQMPVRTRDDHEFLPPGADQACANIATVRIFSRRALWPEPMPGTKRPPKGTIKMTLLFYLYFGKQGYDPPDPCVRNVISNEEILNVFFGLRCTEKSDISSEKSYKILVLMDLI